MRGDIRLGRNVETGEPLSLSAEARRRGAYIIGVTGTGKTTLLENITLDDMIAGEGLFLLDPHGDLIEDLLLLVPAHREHDVILFDAADFERPFGLNLFECADVGNPQEVDLVCSQAVGTFWKLFYYSWGPQMEDLLRNASLTLIYNQPGLTMAELPALLTNGDFRAKLVNNLPNHARQVRLFWEKTYNPLGRYPHQQVQYAQTTLNKVRRFLLNQTVENIVGQEKSTFKPRQFMDEGKIVFANLAKGRLGEDNSNLLGSIMVGKILVAALSRADLPPRRRRPFHLVVDEFQNFATPSFAVLQSEARKYNIDTIVAHQFRDQLDRESQGSSLNVGNLVAFKISGRDAAELAKEFDHTPPEPLVIGERASRALAFSPWSELEKGSHLNPMAFKLVKFLKSMFGFSLINIDNSLSRLIADDDLDRSLNHPAAPNLPEESEDYILTFSDEMEIRSCIKTLDSYLANRMRGVPDEELIDLLLIVINSGPFNDMFYCPYVDQVLGLREVTEWHPQLNRLVFESDISIVRQELEALYPSLFPQHRNNGNTFEKVLTQIRLKRRYLQTVMRLGAILEREPTSVPTGQTEPIYDKQRLYSDMEAETANELANLKVFQAKCRLIQDTGFVECVIKTFPPPAIPPGGEERAIRIRARSRQKYGRSRKQVEREIIERQLFYRLQADRGSGARRVEKKMSDETSKATPDEAPHWTR